MGCCCPLSWAGAVACSEDVSCIVLAPSSSPQVEEGKNEDPDQIDEVPIEPSDLDRRIVARPVVVAAQNLRRDYQQHDHTGAYVQAVEAGDHEEARSELWRA